MRLIGLAAASCIALAHLATAAEPAPIGDVPFADPRHPPAWRELSAQETAEARLGESVFQLQWAPAGTAGAEQKSGVGPLFNATSCDACHNDGAHGRGPIGDGPLPVALVIQLETPPAEKDSASRGDPIYGAVLSTTALAGVQPEGTASVHYREIKGYYYPDGIRWRMRAPTYRFNNLSRGALSPTTIVKPRLAPALFGAGLLQAVPEAAIREPQAAGASRGSAGAPAWRWRQGAKVLGRFGWQGAAVSIRDQSGIAFLREMGLTSPEQGVDDCTPAQSDCLRQPTGGSPEVAPPLLDAVVAYVATLAVPRPGVRDSTASSGEKLFAQIGCAGCHRARLPVTLRDREGPSSAAVIAPYTDLRLHDLGIDMADETATGDKVPSTWRTAPLWGMAFRLRSEDRPTFLHDGRARSVEEAILWHLGEAASVRRKFMNLGPRRREAVIQFVEAL